MNVLHIVLSMEMGGLERVVLSLVREGLSLGQRPAVLCLCARGELAERAEALGASVTCLDKRAGVRPDLTLRIARLLTQRRPDIVHTHQLGALLYGGVAARLARVPLIHTEHGKHYAGFKRRLLGRAAGRLAGRFCCVSRDIADQVAEARVAPARNVQVVPNGIDVAAFARPSEASVVRRRLEIPDDAPVVGTVGRLCEIKRQDLLIRAFALARRQMLDARLLLVGDGPAAAELRLLTCQLGVQDRVHFAGNQREVAPYLHAMDLFILTSRSEGMPLSILEAWAAGAPVVAARVGGIPELLEPGGAGLQFAPADEQAAAEAMLRVLSDRSLADQLATAGREAVAAFDAARMAGSYNRYYMELINRRPFSAPTALANSPA